MFVPDRFVVDQVFQPVVDRYASRISNVDLARICGETAIAGVVIVGGYVALRSQRMGAVITCGFFVVIMWLFLIAMLEAPWPKSALQSLTVLRLTGLIMGFVEAIQFIYTGNVLYAYVLMFSTLWVCCAYFASCVPKKG